MSEGCLLKQTFVCKTIDKIITPSYNNYSKHKFAPLVVFDTLLLFNFILILLAFVRLRHAFGRAFVICGYVVILRLAKLASLLVVIFGFVNWG